MQFFFKIHNELGQCHEGINIFFLIIALLKIKTNIEVYIYQAEVEVITAGTGRKK